MKKIIVSNNNRLVRMGDWVSGSDSRVKFYDQPIDRMCHFRLELARREDSKYFIIVDDDIFLSPAQIEKLIGMLRSEPGRIHGVQGQVFIPERNCFESGVVRLNRPVEIINRVYAFTGEHAQEFFSLVERLGLKLTHPLWTTSFWDDMVLSCAGNKMPYLHDLGPFKNCPTEDSPEIAVWRQDKFFDLRVGLFHRLRSIKKILP